MKKVFKHIYTDSEFREITEWLGQQIYTPEGTIKEYNPHIIVEIVPPTN